ncbi:HAD family hydrolase [Bdellovibrio svalbardensis]|uniref:HAD hydrolase-like protein n=1 Tax=Bdellovibrio svalbardensis TaxID=2972972 RepID=A0ABT6DEQ8_9BACT|nr:HAD hydrolase-like protein [Bdellovibrio svalbardensis]MDG0815320.1 HAD hydrolase-like protein [Bdellovibrio svalbardensis]
MIKYKSIVFDLDDTLLDTSGLLVPMASLRACQAMVNAGLSCTLEECMKMRHNLAAEYSHTEIFTQIANHYGMHTKGKAVHDALEQFYNPDIPAVLPLMTGATENLLHLHERYNLYLVTMGSFEAQAEKIRALQIEKFFKKIYVLNGFIGERKEIAFTEILKVEGHHAKELLSIGNRLSSEIRDAKRVGSDTCYFAHGEHVGEKAQYPEDHPDFTIYHHRDLITTCGL